MSQANVQKSLDVLTSASDEVVETVRKRLNVSSLTRQSEHPTITKQELVANLVLSKRDVGGMDTLVKRMKRSRAMQCGTKRMPLGRYSIRETGVAVKNS